MSKPTFRKLKGPVFGLFSKHKMLLEESLPFLDVSHLVCLHLHNMCMNDKNRKRETHCQQHSLDERSSLRSVMIDKCRNLGITGTQKNKENLNAAH